MNEKKRAWADRVLGRESDAVHAQWNRDFTEITFTGWTGTKKRVVVLRREELQEMKP